MSLKLGTSPVRGLVMIAMIELTRRRHRPLMILQKTQEARDLWQLLSSMVDGGICYAFLAVAIVIVNAKQEGDAKL